MTDVIAHRGASRAARENTIEAFRTAVALGADGVELDVRPTADQVLVVHHDAHGPDGRAIVHTDRAEMPADVADLGAALDACRDVVVNLELKNDPSDPDYDPDDRLAAAVVEFLAERDEPRDRWLISSFRLATVDRVRALAPDLATAWLTITADLDDVARCRDHGHGTWHPWIGAVTAESIAAAHAAGLRVNVWTCNDPDQAARLDGWGVDGIVTDVPDEIRSALAAPAAGATPA